MHSTSSFSEMQFLAFAICSKNRALFPAANIFIPLAYSTCLCTASRNVDTNVDKCASIFMDKTLFFFIHHKKAPSFWCLSLAAARKTGANKEKRSTDRSIFLFPLALPALCGVAFASPHGWPHRYAICVFVYCIRASSGIYGAEHQLSINWYFMAFELIVNY